METYRSTYYFLFEDRDKRFALQSVNINKTLGFTLCMATDCLECGAIMKLGKRKRFYKRGLILNGEFYLTKKQIINR